MTHKGLPAGRASAWRRLREIASEESEARFRAMADSAPVLLWMSGPDALCTFFNQQWLDFTGRPMEAELGSGWAEGIHPEDFQRCMHVYLAAFVERQPFRMEYRLRRRDGEYRWVLDNGIARYTPDDVFAGYIGSCIDVTDRRRAEDEREALLQEARAARDEAERANRLKDEFLAILSHELRTPLNSIQGWAIMLRDGLLTEDEMRRALDSIVRNVQAQGRLISDILDVSRITSGAMRLEIEPCVVAHVLSQAMEGVRPAALAKRIRLEVQLQDLPDGVLVDGARLQQVVWNLLSNAAKFVEEGGWMRLGARVQDTRLEILVEDDGPGIPEDFFAHLFQRFRQADASIRRRHTGLGLGLAIVRHIVELHGGTVSAQNRAEGGAAFLVALPLRLAGTPATPPAPAPPDVSLEGVRVMVVDDDVDSREMVAAALERVGAETELAGSAAEALAQIAKRPPHVLVADIAMPKEDGHYLLNRVRRLPRDQGGETPAVAISAHASPQHCAQALESGFQAHLAKPIAPAALLDVVARLAARSRAC
jgi:PAS domain S-box-containing protein